MGVYEVRALALKMTASAWKLGSALCLCTSHRLPLDLSKYLQVPADFQQTYQKASTGECCLLCRHAKHQRYPVFTD